MREDGFMGLAEASLVGASGSFFWVFLSLFRERPVGAARRVEIQSIVITTRVKRSKINFVECLKTPIMGT